MSNGSAELADIGGWEDTAPEASEMARLACQGEALAALEDFAGLGAAMSHRPGDVLDSLNEAYDLIVDSGRTFSREDFALFFLAQMHGCAEDAATGDALRTGARRYLRDKRAKLAPDLAALLDETAAEPHARASNPDRLLTAFEDLGRPLRARPLAAQAVAPVPRDLSAEREALTARRLRAVETLRVKAVRRRVRLTWAFGGLALTLVVAAWVLSLA